MARPSHRQGRGAGTLKAPDTPGKYELRYTLEGEKVIGRKPIDVK